MRILPILATVLVSTLALADTGHPIEQHLVREKYLAAGPNAITKALYWRVSRYTRIRNTKFMGLSVGLHERVHEPLTCVEQRIRRLCRAEPYTPKTLSGWRPRNSYRGDEVTNHLFGIALDIDPDKNPCCGCKGHWANSHRCIDAKDDGGLGRYDIPQCWIDAFEFYGWYWLGNDPQLRDTMHFEFLAEPGTVHCGPLDQRE